MATQRVTVDEWIQEHVNPELQPIVARLRELMREVAPKARELVSYNMPVYVGRDIFAYLNAARQHITFSFVRGVQLEDKYGLLRGSAKHARYLRLKTVEDINKTVLRYYVRQAIVLDRELSHVAVPRA
jgi:hypothetical protein